MIQTTPPQIKSEICEHLSVVFQDVESHLTNYNEAEFTAPYMEKWSAAEHLAHLILSAYPVAAVLKQDRAQLEVFGFNESPSRTFSELYQAYKDRLAAGQKADAKRIPQPGNDSHKVEMLQNLKGIFQKIDERLAAWNEEELDRYCVPHPALGKITMRELLFFTCFHTAHHIHILKDRVSNL